MRWLVATLTACLAIAACALPSADEFASGRVGDGGVLAIEAGAPVPGLAADGGDAPPGVVDGVLDAGTDAMTPLPPTDLLAGAGTFERASGCVSQGSILATFTEALGSDGSVFHGGARSCKLCRDGSEGTFSIEHGYPTRASGVPKGTYRAEAWVKKVPGGAAPVAMLSLRTYQFFPFDDDVSQRKDSSPTIIADDWQRLTIDLVVTQASSKIEASVSFEAPRAAGVCGTIDDVVIYEVE